MKGGRQQALVALEKLDENTDYWTSQPNRSPPEGEERALHNYFEKNPNFHCQVNTFGFGYSLNSKLLQDIAIRGRGTFSFIPDAKIVGTCFVSAVSNACSTMSQNCKVHLILKNNAQFTGPVSGNYIVDEPSWGRVVDIGPLHYGQSRDVVVSMNLPAISPNSNIPYLEVVVEYDNSTGDAFHKISAEGSLRDPTFKSILASVRNQVVSSVYHIIDECEKGNGPNGVREMKALVGKVAAYEAESKYLINQSETLLTGLNTDVSGRISKAISTVERFKRWGKHYLRAVIRAHQLQIRTNYMDPGLQFYGGSLFKSLDEEGGKIFLTLTMKRRADYQQQLYLNPYNPAVAPAQHYVPPPDNSTYYGGSGGGCFARNSSVELYQPKPQQFITIPINHLKKGDFVKVKTIDGLDLTTRVECVVAINRKISSSLVEFKSSGLKITKNHPIRINAQWCLPKDMLNGNDVVFVESKEEEEVYNLVLERRDVLLEVNGIECVTFGHGFETEVVYDSFYGTEKVLDTIAVLPGWENGLVTVHGSLRSLYPQH
jgi:hypothetical protein